MACARVAGALRRAEAKYRTLVAQLGRSYRMNPDTIICPNCKVEIPLSQVMAQRISEECKQKWASEKKQLLERERARLKFEMSEEVADLKARLEEKDKKLAAARSSELKLLKLQS